MPSQYCLLKGTVEAKGTTEPRSQLKTPLDTETSTCSSCQIGIAIISFSYNENLMFTVFDLPASSPVSVPE